MVETEGSVGYSLGKSNPGQPEDSVGKTLKSNGLSPIPRTHAVEGDSLLLRTVTRAPHMLGGPREHVRGTRDEYS